MTLYWVKEFKAFFRVCSSSRSEQRGHGGQAICGRSGSQPGIYGKRCSSAENPPQMTLIDSLPGESSRRARSEQVQSLKSQCTLTGLPQQAACHRG